jgi:hypothetical protein
MPKGQGDPDQKVEYRTVPIITLRTDGNGPDYLPALLNRDTPFRKGISIRSSVRWLDTFNTPNGGLAVPYIDRLGRFTGQVIYKWSCDPRSLIATVVSTIAKRLVDHARRHNKWYIVKKRLKDLLSAAAYYAFTKNSYFWDRVLCFSRDLEKYKKPLNSLRIFFTSKWDENKRFVYSHVIFQTKWLLFRVFRPRDKSQFLDSKTGRWSNPSECPSKLVTTNTMREIAYAISSM